MPISDELEALRKTGKVQRQSTLISSKTNSQSTTLISPEQQNEILKQKLLKEKKSREEASRFLRNNRHGGQGAWGDLLQRKLRELKRQEERERKREAERNLHGYVDRRSRFEKGSSVGSGKGENDESSSQGMLSPDKSEREGDEDDDNLDAVEMLPDHVVNSLKAKYETTSAVEALDRALKEEEDLGALVEKELQKEFSKELKELGGQSTGDESSEALVEKVSEEKKMDGAEEEAEKGDDKEDSDDCEKETKTEAGAEAEAETKTDAETEADKEAEVEDAAEASKEAESDEAKKETGDESADKEKAEEEPAKEPTAEESQSTNVAEEKAEEENSEEEPTKEPTAEENQPTEGNGEVTSEEAAKENKGEAPNEQPAPAESEEGDKANENNNSPAPEAIDTQKSMDVDDIEDMDAVAAEIQKISQRLSVISLDESDMHLDALEAAVRKAKKSVAASAALKSRDAKVAKAEGSIPATNEERIQQTKRFYETYAQAYISINEDLSNDNVIPSHHKAFLRYLTQQYLIQKAMNRESPVKKKKNGEINSTNKDEENSDPVFQLVDLGCGHGEDTKIFSNQRHHVLAIDYSMPLLSHAKSLAPNAHFINMDMRQCSTAMVPHSIDGVWINASLFHLPKVDAEKVLRGLFEAVKEGGVMYVNFKLMDEEELAQSKNGGEEFEPDLRYKTDESEESTLYKLYSYYTEGEVKQMLENVGWKVMESGVDDRRGADKYVTHSFMYVFANTKV